MRTLVMLAVAAALVQDPPGGKISWQKDPVAAEKRGRLEQRAVLFYFTDGGTPCKALDAGAFSNSDVVSVARRIFPVILECPDDKAWSDLRSRFKVTGFPMLAIVEPDGKTHHEITAREAAEVAGELNRVAKKFPGRDILWLSSLESAVEKAKDDARPIAIYFHAADDDLVAAQDRMVKLAAQSRLDKFIWVELSATTDDKDPLKSKYDIITLPAIAFVDPRFSPPRQFGIYDLTDKRKPKDVQDKLEERLKKYKDTKVKK